MKRNEEQRAADEALSAAIDCVIRAYGMQSENEVNGEYVVVIEQQRMEDEDEIQHSYCTLFKEGKVAAPLAIGLLETASFDLKMGRS